MQPLPILRSFGWPVVSDARHSVQLPARGRTRSSGHRQLVALLARAAVCAGIEGLFLEVHPDRASSPDGPNMMRLEALPLLLENVRRVRDVGGGT